MKRQVLWLTTAIGFASIVAYFALPRLAPRILARIFPGIIFQISAQERVVYLTIDDTPSSATPLILAVLSKHQVPATFFIIGSWVEDEHRLSEIRDAGHQLGNHMWTTKPGGRLSLDEFRAQFDATEQRLRPFQPKYFRPPSGSSTEEQLAYVRAQGLVPVLGTAFPMDSSIQHPAMLRALVTWLVVPGAIVIMHDGNKRGETTAAVLDEVIPELRSCGYEFRTLPASGAKRVSEQAERPAVLKRRADPERKMSTKVLEQ